MSSFVEKYNQFLTANLPVASGGGIASGNLAIWYALFDAQLKARITGHCLEIGVWRGHASAAMALQLSDKEKLILIDRYAKPDQFMPNIQTFLHSADQLSFFGVSSFEAYKKQLLRDFADSVRFIHIDGEHSYEAVYNDLELCIPLLREGGLIVLDDMFTAGGPHLTEAMFKWLWRNDHNATLLLTGFNKAYLCHPRAATIYTQTIYELPDILEAVGHRIMVLRGARSTEKSVVGILPRHENFKYARVGKYHESLSFEDFWVGFECL